ncbi:MAG: hypothetical protein O7E53_00695, partial [Alphaproteobacteria bacterium]|nr:hypothetical protein [Alphaproteobacteria bacterium]
MKFLIFNITVAVALIYLFTVDRAEVQSTAGRIHDAASEVKQAANRVVDQGRRWVSPTPEQPGTKPARRAGAASGATALDRVEGPADLAPLPLGQDRAPLAYARNSGMSNGTISANDRTAGLREPSATTAPEPVSADAAALRRREEILRGIDPAILKPAVLKPADLKPAILTPGVKPDKET